jgi:translation initiation factor 5
MSEIITKVESSADGIRTVLVNMPDIAKDLNRPPAYITKYVGFILDVPTTVDSAANRYVIHGQVDIDRLSQIINDFIDKYVICPSCDSANTSIFVCRKVQPKMAIGDVALHCIHCGEMNAIIGDNKMEAFIQKNPQ